MKPIATLLTLLCLSASLQSQTITYSNFMQSVGEILPINLANNNSFNPMLTTTTGNNVTWDASALSLQAGFPTVHLKYHQSSATPYAAIYPNANYTEYDSALIANIALTYFNISADSLVEWGVYEASGKHEVFQNPDKHLVFPFSLGDQFTDQYAKTNYSDATTVSSYQTGDRTVIYAGYGTLILPQGSFPNTALVTEHRTNSLGPDSYTYTWYDVNTGKKRLLRSENGSSIRTAWNADPMGTFVPESDNNEQLLVFPNPAQEVINLRVANTPARGAFKVDIKNMLGQTVHLQYMNTPELSIGIGQLAPGLYLLELSNAAGVIATEKLLINSR